MAITRLVGSSVRRREDPRLLRGAGQFVADIALPGMLHMAIVRSSRPHAILKEIDRSAAESEAGVLLILDGAEIAATVNPLPSIDLFPDSKPALMRALAVDRVRYAGEPIAMVVATNAEIARSAARAMRVEYENLPVLLDPEEAVRDATLLYPEHGTNVANVCRQQVGDVDLAFARADIPLRQYFASTAPLPHPWKLVALSPPLIPRATGSPSTPPPNSLTLYAHFSPACWACLPPISGS